MHKRVTLLVLVLTAIGLTALVCPSYSVKGGPNYWQIKVDRAVQFELQNGHIYAPQITMKVNQPPPFAVEQFTVDQFNKELAAQRKESPDRTWYIEKVYMADPAQMTAVAAMFR